MKKITLLTISMLLFCPVVSLMAKSNVANKKETAQIIKNIRDAINSEEYEKAFKFAFSNEREIQEKNIAKVDRQFYKDAIERLNKKKVEFKSVGDSVNNAKRLFTYKKYWEAAFIIDQLSLSNKNSYGWTQVEFKTLKRMLESKRASLDTLNANVPRYISEFDNSNFEGLFYIFDISDFEGYLSPENRNEISKLLTKLREVKSSYDGIVRTKIEEPNQFFLKNNPSTYSHKEAISALERCDYYINIIKDVDQCNIQSFPNLSFRLQETRAKLDELKSQLLKREKETQPYNIAFGGGIFTSMKQIEADCNGDTDKIIAIMELDVFEYYGLDGKYDSELKRTSFKETIEYKKLEAQLKQLKNTVYKTVYYESGTIEMGDFDIKSKCFLVPIGRNVGVYIHSHAFAAKPPKTFNNIVFKSLPTVQKRDLDVGELYKDKSIADICIPVNVSFSTAERMERKKAKMYVLFCPSSIEKFTFEFIHLNTYSFTTTHYEGSKRMLSSSKCRVLIFDEDGTLFFDKVYIKQ